MIKGMIKGQSLRLTYPTLVSDSVAYLTATFSFLTDDWQGLDKWAQFTKGDETYSFRLENDGIDRAEGLNLSAGRWEVSVYGVATDGDRVERRITTKPQTLVVAQSGVLEGEPMPITPPSLGEQILATADRALAIAEGVRRDADAGAFRGEKGEKGDPVEVFQFLGDSETGVVSQKATSEAVRGLASRVTNLEAAARGELYDDVEDAGKAHTVALPGTVLPNGAVSVVGGGTRGRERNLVPFPYGSGITERSGEDDRYEVVIHPDATIAVSGYGGAGRYGDLIAAEDGWYVGNGRFVLTGSAQDAYLTVSAYKNEQRVAIAMAVSEGDSAILDLSDIAYDYLTLSLAIEIGGSDEPIGTRVVRPQLESGETATEFEPFTLHATPVHEVLVRGRNVGEFAVTTKNNSEVEGGDGFFRVTRVGSGSSNLIVRYDRLEVGKTYTAKVRLVGLSETSASKTYVLMQNDNANLYSGGGIGVIAGYAVRPFQNTFIAATRYLGMIIYNSVSVGEAYTFEIELIEGAVSGTVDDFSTPWTHRLAIPETVTEGQSDSWGWSVGDRYSYIDFAEGKYHARARVRSFAEGDQNDPSVLTDGTRTVEPWDEVIDLTMPDPLVPMEGYGSVVFENDGDHPVFYRLDYQTRK